MFSIFIEYSFRKKGSIEMNIQMSSRIIVHRGQLLGIMSPMTDWTSWPEQEKMSPQLRLRLVRLRELRLNLAKEKIKQVEKMQAKLLGRLKIVQERQQTGDQSLSVPCVWRRWPPGSRYSSAALVTSRAARVDPRLRVTRVPRVEESSWGGPWPWRDWPRRCWHIRDNQSFSKSSTAWVCQ